MLDENERNMINLKIPLWVLLFTSFLIFSVNKSIQPKPPLKIEKKKILAPNELYSNQEKECLLQALFGEVYGKDHEEKIALLTYFIKEAKTNKRTFCQEWNKIESGKAKKYSSNNSKDLKRIKSNPNYLKKQHRQFINDFLDGKIKQNNNVKNMTNFLTIKLFKSKNCPIWAKRIEDYIIIDKTIYVKSNPNIKRFDIYRQALKQIKK